MMFRRLLQAPPAPLLSMDGKWVGREPWHSRNHGREAGTNLRCHEHDGHHDDHHDDDDNAADLHYHEDLHHDQSLLTASRWSW